MTKENIGPKASESDLIITEKKPAQQTSITTKKKRRSNRNVFLCQLISPPETEGYQMTIVLHDIDVEARKKQRPGRAGLMNTLRFFYIVSRASDSLYYRIIIYKGGIAYMRRTAWKINTG